MITSYKNCKDRGYLSSFKVLYKVAELFILLRTVHVFQILLMSNWLKISTNDKKIKLLIYFLFYLCELRIDLIEFSVKTALNCNLYQLIGTLICL